MSQRTKPPFLHLTCVFLFAFTFIVFCFVGLPCDFNADHVTINVRGAQSLSYSDLIRLTLNPLTPAWFYPPSGLMEYLRPLEFLWMKVYFDAFQSSLIPFHLTAAVGCGLLAVIFFLMIFYGTNSALFGWLAVLLYISFPSNFFLLTSTFSVGFEYYVSVFSIAALWLFGRLTFGTLKSALGFSLNTLSWIATVWLSIKLKSSEKILPLVFLAFLLWRLKFIRSRIGSFRLGILVACIGLMVLMVIPTRSFEQWVRQFSPQTDFSSVKSRMQKDNQPMTQKDKMTFSFHWKNLLARTFLVPGGEFPFSTVYRKAIPRSFSENYGFFLSWFFWISLLLTPFVLAHAKEPDPSDPLPISQHYFWLTLIWFGATIAGFANGLSVEDTRFLNVAYVPSVLLFFAAMGILERNFFPLAKQRLFFRLFLTSAVLYTSLTNFPLFSKLLVHFGGMQDTVVRAERDVFESFYGKKPAGPWTLYEKHHELETRAVVVDWYDLQENWFDQALEKLKRENKIYFYTRTPDGVRLKKFQEAGYAPILWKRYDFFDAKPLAFKFFKANSQIKQLLGKRAKRQEVLIYQIQASLPGHEPFKPTL